MKRIKIMGLAITAAMALTALLGASSASASQFRAEEYPATATGTQGVQQQFTTTGGVVTKCATATASGIESAASSALTLTPAFGSCKWAGTAATISANSCQYVLKSTNEKAPYTGSLDIACGKAGDAIEVISSMTNCRTKFPAQSALGAVTFANSGSNRSRVITATLNITGLKYTETGSECVGSGTYSTGTYTGSSVIKGFNEKAGHAVGVYLANEQIADPTQFEGESYPLIIQGEQQEQMTFKTSMGTFKCTAVTSHGELAGPSAVLKQEAAFSGCKFAGLTVPISMNSCSLTLNALSTESPFASGSLDVACSKVGDAITLMVGSCETRILAQGGASSVQFQNTGTGSSRGISAVLGLTNLKYTEAIECAKPGTHEDGGLSGSLSLKGYQNSGGIPGAQKGIWVE